MFLICVLAHFKAKVFVLEYRIEYVGNNTFRVIMRTVQYVVQHASTVVRYLFFCFRFLCYRRLSVVDFLSLLLAFVVPFVVRTIIISAFFLLDIVPSTVRKGPSSVSFVCVLFGLTPGKNMKTGKKDTIQYQYQQR